MNNLADPANTNPISSASGVFQTDQFHNSPNVIKRLLNTGL